MEPVVAARTPTSVVIAVGGRLYREGLAALLNAQILTVAFAVRTDISTIVDHAKAGADAFETPNGSVADLVEAIPLCIERSA